AQSAPGSPGTLKVLDLGLARLASPDPGAQAATLTQMGAFMGTPDYIAPQQASDAPQADARSDLYSLGGTLYFLLAGRPPFEGSTPLAKLMQHHLEDPPQLEQLRPDVPPGVAAVVRRLMAKRPQDRFQSGAELAQALEPFLPAGRRPAAQETAR